MSSLLDRNHLISQDIALVVVFHVALLWFLASHWQAPNKAEQLRQLQQQMPNKISAFLYYAPPEARQAVAKTAVHQVVKSEPKVVQEPDEIILMDKVEKQAVKPKPQALVNQTQPKSFNFRAATQSYLKRNQLQQLDDFQLESEQYRYASTSEMTPQMKQEWLPEAEGFDKKLTLDHQFDPNRVYRFGSTCYRVVKIIDPIAGDSENLGYKFKCGQTDQEKALAASLEKYTKKKR